MDIFSSLPGQVTVILGTGIPMNLFLEGWGGYASFKSVITGIQVQTKSGVQYLHTLRDLIYVYVFMERIAPVTISGVSFASSCEWLEDALGAPDHGVEYAYAYYLNNRVSSIGTPVTIVLGASTPFFGFLDGAQVSMTDTERVLGQFSFNFSTIPQPSLLDLLT